MKSVSFHGLFLAVSLVFLVVPAQGQSAPESNSLLPLPHSSYNYPQTSTAYQSYGHPGGSYSPVSYRGDESTRPPQSQDEDLGPLLYGGSSSGHDGGYGHHGADGQDAYSWAGCSDCGQAECGCRGRWFGSAGWLYMTRDNENPVWLSFDTSNVGSSLLGTPDAQMGWASGVDIRVGRWFADGCTAWELGYWGVYPDAVEANAFDPDGITGNAQDLNTVFNFQSLDYNGLGNPIVNWFDNAERHRLVRSNEIHNIEWNLIRRNGGCDPCARWQTNWIAGFRYFKFGDGFNYASDDADLVFTGAVDEVYYEVDVQNHLLGGQVGCRLDYAWTPCFDVFGIAKVGLYGNHLTHYSFVGGSAGAAVVNDPASPNDGQAFDLTSSKNDVSFLAELNGGMTYRFSKRWSAMAGYRAVAVTGVGLSTNQIPMNFADLRGVEAIDSNGSLILHGGYAGLEFNY